MAGVIQNKQAPHECLMQAHIHMLARTLASSQPASQPGPFLPTATLCQLMLNYSWLTCWIKGERPEQKSASTEMKEIVKSSRNPRTSKYQALIVRCLESWFCQEKQNRQFSVDWVLRQKHLMTTTKRSGKVVSHYTSSAIHWPIILQTEVWNL